MRILIVGCGAIGRRHAQHARAHGEIGVVDGQAERARAVAEETGAHDFGDALSAGLAWQPDGVVVAVPHQAHLAVAEQAIRADIPVLIEKPIGLEPARVASLLELAEARGCGVWVVSNMRFHPALQALRQHLPAVGRIYFARAHFGNYLPDMRPGRDYRELYAADAQYGGVVLDAIHEIDYLDWLLGPVARLTAHTAQLSELALDAEDYAHALLQHSSGAYAELHLDFVRRGKRRGCELVGSEGILHWISEGKRPERCQVRLYTPAAGWQALLDGAAIQPDTALQEMLAGFVAALQGRETALATGRDGYRALVTALAARAGEGHEREISP